MPWPLNWVEKVMTLVVPPASADTLPVVQLSSSAPPASCNCSIWQCESTPPGSTSSPPASTVRSPFRSRPIAAMRPCTTPTSARKTSAAVTTVPPATTSSYSAIAHLRYQRPRRLGPRSRRAKQARWFDLDTQTAGDRQQGEVATRNAVGDAADPAFQRSQARRQMGGGRRLIRCEQDIANDRVGLAHQRVHRSEQHVVVFNDLAQQVGKNV